MRESLRTIGFPFYWGRQGEPTPAFVNLWTPGLIPRGEDQRGVNNEQHIAKAAKAYFKKRSYGKGSLSVGPSLTKERRT